MKKILIALLLLLMFSVNISAISIDQITPGSEFYNFSVNPEKVAEILDTDIEDLNDKVKNQNIRFLAVNQEKTKQIQLTVSNTEFASTVGNLSNLSDTSIKSLLPDITGLQNITGKIVFKDGQKYVYVNLKSDDYVLTQYFTVEDGKLYTLSFYTDINERTDYITTAFHTKQKIEDTINIKNISPAFKVVVIIGTVIFGIAFIVILISILKDIILKSS